MTKSSEATLGDTGLLEMKSLQLDTITLRKDHEADRLEFTEFSTKVHENFASIHQNFDNIQANFTRLFSAKALAKTHLPPPETPPPAQPLPGTSPHQGSNTQVLNQPQIPPKPSVPTVGTVVLQDMAGKEVNLDDTLK
jgi:hypothetical protein